MRKLTWTLLLGVALFTLTGCDDLLEDLNIDIYGVPGYAWSGGGGYYEETVVEEYWYEDTYYQDTTYDEIWYDGGGSFWPW